MARGDVRNLVRHNARQLRLVIRGENQALINIEKPARKRKSVDLVRINHLDGEGDARVRVQNYVLAYAVDVLRDEGVVYELGLFVYLCGQLATQCNLFLKR